MEFEFDEQKSNANLAKHGIDFVEAQALWLDENRVEIPARNDRWDRLRLIPTRRARPEEVAIYESEGL